MPRIAKKKDVAAVQNVAEITENKVAAVPKAKTNGYVFYSVWSRSRGWQTESLSLDRACETLDSYYADHLRRVNYEDRKEVFDYYILKRDTTVNTAASEWYQYEPGSFSANRREEYLRAKYGDRYKEDDGEDFDSAKYAEDFKASAK